MSGSFGPGTHGCKAQLPQVACWPGPSRGTLGGDLDSEQDLYCLLMLSLEDGLDEDAREAEGEDCWALGVVG